MFRSVVRADAAGLDGVLLGGQAKGVPAHGMQDVDPAHPFEAGNDVGGRVAFGMADVQPVAARIGKHVEHVVFRLRGIEIGFAWDSVHEKLYRPANKPAIWLRIRKREIACVGMAYWAVQDITALPQNQDLRSPGAVLTPGIAADQSADTGFPPTIQ